jgi:hypothetical protein
MNVVFDEHRCVCEHPAASHDDGFGCTEVIPGSDEPCPCLAGWSLEQEATA